MKIFNLYLKLLLYILKVSLAKKQTQLLLKELFCVFLYVSTKRNKSWPKTHFKFKLNELLLKDTKNKVKSWQRWNHFKDQNKSCFATFFFFENFLFYDFFMSLFSKIKKQTNTNFVFINYTSKHELKNSCCNNYNFVYS